MTLAYEQDWCFGNTKEEEPKVILTIKEAKEILQSSYDVLSWASCPYIHEDNALKVQRILKIRIEQAEMSIAST